MKTIKSFEEFINEGMSWGAEVAEPFDANQEKKVASKFAIKMDPITVVGVSGDIQDDNVDIHIQFSNGEYIESDYQNGVDIYNAEQQNMFSNRDQGVVAGYWGSTGTVVGDLCLIYRDWKLGKLK